jgi:hypothetical protein
MFWFSLSHVLPVLQPFIRWCAGTAIGQYIHTVTWAFPLLEAIHIVALVVLLGTTMLVNLTMLGFVRGWSPARIAHNVAWFANSGLVGVILTGALLFVSDPWRYYASEAFGPKILMLSLAILFQFAVYPRVLRIDRAFTPWPGRLAACVSLALWFGVGAAGRAIAWV